MRSNSKVSFQMSWPRRYLVALLPAAATVGGWQVAQWAFEYFGCQGDIKHMRPCLVGPVDLLPLMGLGLFWLPIASLLTVPISIWMLIMTAAKHIGSHNGAAES